jgi:hypothetical protein
LHDVFSVLFDPIILTRWLDSLVLLGTNVVDVVDGVDDLPYLLRRLILFVDFKLKVLLEDGVSC